MDNTTALVILKHGEPFTNSLLIAEKFHKEHRNIIAKIRFLKAEIDEMYSGKKIPQHSAKKLADLKIEDYNPKFIESTYKDSQGKVQPLYFLNQDAFVEVVGNLNGKEARQWKREYHAAFNKMAKIIVNQQNAEWLETRKDVKVLYRKMTDSLKVLVDYATAAGSKNADKLYMTYNKLINKNLGLQAGQRDSLTIWQLHEIEKMQSMIETIVKGLIAKGVEYHEIYRDTKQIIESYSALAYFNGTHAALTA